MIKAVIVEDEQLATLELKDTLREVAPEIEVVAVARSVDDAITLLRNAEYDLVFMDIHLGDGISFDIFDEVSVSVPVIFITAYDSYALQAFANRGLDYLLKPFGPEDLQRAIEKLGLFSKISPLEPTLPVPPLFQERFLVNEGDRIISIPTDRIAYFMADGKYVHIRTFEGEDYLADKTLTELCESLDPRVFFRINRKFLVNYSAIREMVRYSGNRIRVTLHPPVPHDVDTIVSGERIHPFREWLSR